VVESSSFWIRQLKFFKQGKFAIAQATPAVDQVWAALDSSSQRSGTPPTSHL
jgi:hypothetical protein